MSGTTDTQLKNKIRTIKIKKEYGKFLGIFASDELPKVVRPCCMIVNYDKKDMGGTHWIAMAFPSMDSATYFDSYGMKPDGWDHVLQHNTDFHEYLLSNSSTGKYYYNDLDFQSRETDSCGEFCIYYLKHGLPDDVNGKIRPTWNILWKLPKEKRYKIIINLIGIRKV